MFSILISFNWFRGFGICSIIEMYLHKSGIQKSNIITCILFQMYFVLKSFSLIISELNGHDTQKETILNICDLYGYFMYDTIYMIYMYKTKPKQLFILHHIASLIMINEILILEVKETFNHNIICFLAEVTNPFLNTRQFTFEYPKYKKIITEIIYHTYFYFRIILFPVFSALFIYTNPNYILFTLFIMIYGVSLMWFIKIIELKDNENSFELFA